MGVLASCCTVQTVLCLNSVLLSIIIFGHKLLPFCFQEKWLALDEIKQEPAPGFKHPKQVSHLGTEKLWGDMEHVQWDSAGYLASLMLYMYWWSNRDPVYSITLLQHQYQRVPNNKGTWLGYRHELHRFQSCLSSSSSTSLHCPAMGYGT